MALVNIGLTVAQDLVSSGDQGLNVAGLKITVPTGGKYTLVSMSMIVTTAAGSLRMGFYDDTGTQATQPRAPGNLLAETGAQVLVNGLNTLPVLAQRVISAGDYWLNYNQSANVTWTQHDTHVQGNSLFYVAPFSAFDNPFTPGSSNDSAIYPIYATFDLVSGGNKVGKQRRHFVEIDGETFQVADERQARDILEQAKEIADQTAERKARAAIAKAAPTEEPEPEVPQIEVAPGLEQSLAKVVQDTRDHLDRAYREAMQKQLQQRAREQEAEEGGVIKAVTDYELSIIKQFRKTH